MSRRTAYWRPEIRRRLLGEDGQLVATRSRQGVWLAALWRFPARSAEQPAPADRDVEKSARRVPAQISVPNPLFFKGFAKLDPFPLVATSTIRKILSE